MTTLLEAAMNTPLEDFLERLTTRPRNIIKAEIAYFENFGDAEIKPPFTVRHLMMLSRKEISKWPNMGKKSLNEIEENLRELGLQLWHEHDERSLKPLRTAIAEAEKQEPPYPQAWAKFLHYPDCWDTAAYPTLHDAIHEGLAWSGCSVCKAAAPVPDHIANGGNMVQAQEQPSRDYLAESYRQGHAAGMKAAQAQEHKPLTDEQIDAAWRSVDYTQPYADFRMAVGRAIEAKVREQS